MDKSNNGCDKIKLRNTSRFKKQTPTEEHKKHTRAINYNIFDELQDSSDDEDTPPVIRMTVLNSTDPTDLLFSQTQFDAFQSDDFFLTSADHRPTKIITQFSQHQITVHKWTRFYLQQHSVWITPTLHMDQLIDNNGILRNNVLTSNNFKANGFRCISATRRETTTLAAQLIIDIETSFKQETFTLFE